MHTMVAKTVAALLGGTWFQETPHVMGTSCKKGTLAVRQEKASRATKTPVTHAELTQNMASIKDSRCNLHMVWHMVRKIQVTSALPRTDTPVRTVTSAQRQSGNQHRAMKLTVMALDWQKAACVVILTAIWLTAMGIPIPGISKVPR